MRRVQIPESTEAAFDTEVWEGFLPRRRRTLRKRLERAVDRRSALEWLVQVPIWAIKVGGFVRTECLLSLL